MHSLGDVCVEIQRRKAKARGDRQKALDEAAASLLPTLSPSLQRAAEVASDSGASYWLSAIPVDSHGFALPKGSFRDVLCLRYNLSPDHLPSQCVCGSAFSVDHALSCATGYSIMRHNELRDLTASLLSEVCHDVGVEPVLQPLSDEILTGRSANVSPEARFSRTLVDVRVFHPNASSVRTVPLSSQYTRHERIKRR